MPVQPFTHVHYSGRWDRTAESMMADLARFERETGATLMTITEVGNNARAGALDTPGWSIVNSPDSDLDDCAIRYRDGVWAKLHAEVEQLTELRYRKQDGSLAEATAAVAAVLWHASGFRLLAVAAHMPPTIEGPSGFQDNQRARVAKDAAVNLQAYVDRLERAHQVDAVLISPDWNLNLRLQWVRSWLTRTYPDLRPTWRTPFPVDGTHGARLIDVALAGGLSIKDGPRLLRTPSSDHRAFAQTLQPTLKEPTPMATINQRVIANARKRGVDVLTREQWGSKPSGVPWPLAPDVADVYGWRRVNKPHGQLPGTPTDTVVQHITVTRRTSSFRADLRTVERIGFERFGSGFSYNWGVDMVTGQVGEGQPLDAKGTHTVNDKNVPGYTHDLNKKSIAIAVIGMPGDKLSAKAEAAIAKLIAAHVDEDAVTDTFDYDPHSKFAFKECPVRETRGRMPAIRAAVFVELKPPTPPKPPTPAPVETHFTRARKELTAAAANNTGLRRAAALAALKILPKR